MKKTTIEIMQEEITLRKAKDSGKLGDAFELAIRSYLTGRRWHKVKRQGAPDITKKINGKTCVIEIKSACGELPTGNFDYVVYAPDVDITFPAEWQGYIFTREQWNAFISGYTGRGKLVRYDAQRDKEHIQSFYVSDTVRPKASKPIAEYIWGVCYELPTVDEFFAK